MPYFPKRFHLLFAKKPFRKSREWNKYRNFFQGLKIKACAHMPNQNILLMASTESATFSKIHTQGTIAWIKNLWSRSDMLSIRTKYFRTSLMTKKLKKYKMSLEFRSPLSCNRWHSRNYPGKVEKLRCIRIQPFFTMSLILQKATGFLCKMWPLKMGAYGSFLELTWASFIFDKE